MDQNLVSISKFAKATDWHPDYWVSLIVTLHDQQTPSGKRAFIRLLIHFYPGEGETEHRKDSSEEVDRAKAQGTESPSVSCPPHSTAVHS